MKSIRPLLLLVLALVVLQTGCSNRNSSQPQKNVGQPVANKEQPKQSGTHYILGGMTKEQGETLATAIQKADVEMSPILKGVELERENPAAAVSHYQGLLESGRFQVESHLGLSRAYEKLGDYTLAAEQLELALPLVNDWARPEYEKKLSELKAKATQQIEK